MGGTSKDILFAVAPPSPPLSSRNKIDNNGGNDDDTGVLLEAYVNQNTLLQKRISDYELYTTPMVKRLQQREEEIKELKESNKILEEKCKQLNTQGEIKHLIEKNRKLEEKNLLLEAQNTQLHVRNIGLEKSLRQAGEIIGNISVEQQQQEQQQRADELLQTIQASRLREQLMQEQEQAQALQRAQNDEEKLKLHRMILFQRELQLSIQQQNLRNNRPCVEGDRVVIVGSSGGRYDGREGLVVSDNSTGSANSMSDPTTCWVKIVDGEEETLVELPASNLLRLRRKNVPNNAGNGNKRPRSDSNADRIDAAAALRHLRQKTQDDEDDDVGVIESSHSTPGVRVSDDESCRQEEADLVF